MRFPLGYDILGYEPGFWTSVVPGRSGDDLLYGGLQCGVAGAEDDDYSTALSPEENNCFGIRGILYNRPPTLFLRSQMTAIDLDGLKIITLPGEASMELGWQLLREIDEAYGIDPLEAWVWGYAQDHQFYLTPSNLRGPLPPFPGISTPMAPDDYPDLAFSYYQGGYEAGFTIWGARMGDFLVARGVEAMGLMLGEDVEPAFDEPLPTQYSKRGDPEFPVTPTAQDAVGTVTTEPPAQVERLTQIEYAWIGGDPGAEMPQAPRVVLEQDNGDGTFAPVLHVNRRPYDNREPLMLTRVRQLPDTEQWEWVVYWEELKDFAAGTYRFKVEGHYLDEEQGRMSYEATSRTFEVVPSTAVAVEATPMGSTLRGSLRYPAAPRMEFSGATGDPGAVTGSYRMRHPDVPTDTPDPVFAQDLQTLTIEVTQGGQTTTYTLEDVTVMTAPETVDGRDDVPVTRFELQAPALTPAASATITVTDIWGNTGSRELTP